MKRSMMIRHPCRRRQYLLHQPRRRTLHHRRQDPGDLSRRQERHNLHGQGRHPGDCQQRLRPGKVTSPNRPAQFHQGRAAKRLPRMQRVTADDIPLWHDDLGPRRHEQQQHDDPSHAARHHHLYRRQCIQPLH